MYMKFWNRNRISYSWHTRLYDILLTCQWQGCVKPIFHWFCVVASRCEPQRDNFALPIPTCWYLKSLADPTRGPTDPTWDPTWLVEYRLRWVPWRWGLHWACTFHVVYFLFPRVGYPKRTQFPVAYGLKNCEKRKLKPKIEYWNNLMLYIHISNHIIFGKITSI